MAKFGSAAFARPAATVATTATVHGSGRRSVANVASVAAAHAVSSDLDHRTVASVATVARGICKSATSEPQVLRPFDRREAITVDEAAELCARDVRTVRRWCVAFDIGRRIAGGPWSVSVVALSMLLNDDKNALRQYLAGDRRSALIVAYFESADLGDLPHHWAAREAAKA